MRLLERIHDDALARGAGDAVELVFLGDYVDRGPESNAVVAALRRLRVDNPQYATLLMGNHEAAMLAFLDDPVQGADWLRMGGMQTFESYRVPPPLGAGFDALIDARDALRAAMGPDEAFLRDTLLRWTRSGDVVFVHAAMDPDRPHDAQNDDALLWGRAPDFYARGAPPGVVVVHGHTPSDEPVILPWRIGVDTGAYYSGRLTALRIDADGIAFIAT